MTSFSFFALNVRLDFVLKACLLNKEGLTVLIDLFNILNVLGVGLDVFDDFEAEKFYDNLNTLVADHHFLVV